LAQGLALWNRHGVRAIFYDDPLPESLAGAHPSIFLAGPTASGIQRTPWRAQALTLLEARGYSGVVILPEFRSTLFADTAPRVFGVGTSVVPHMRTTSYNILRWETAGIELATVVLFWMPFQMAEEGDPASLPGFTTRAEVSREMARAPERSVLGMPPGALSSSHIRYHAHQHGLRIHDTLEDTVAEAAARCAS
jgi:hypothetical protein